MPPANRGRGPVVAALLVVGSVLIARSPNASTDAIQVLGLLTGSLGVGVAAWLLRDSLLNR